MGFEGEEGAAGGQSGLALISRAAPCPEERKGRCRSGDSGEIQRRVKVMNVLQVTYCHWHPAPHKKKSPGSH